MKKILHIIGFVSFVLILGIVFIVVWSTGKMPKTSQQTSYAPTIATSMGIPMGIEMMDQAQQKDMLGNGTSAEDRAKIGPKIIKNGSLTIRVSQLEQKLDELTGLAKDLGGYIDESRISDSGNNRTAFATLRIPSNKFDEGVSAIRKMALVVFDQYTNSEDVTAQFVDLDARLKAAKAEEAQYLEILKRAGSIKDTLEVAARLGEVRSRIEQMEGELRYLRDHTDYATLSVQMTEETSIAAPTRTWKPWETLKQSFQGLIIALQVLIDILIVAATFLIGFLLPILIILGLIAWIIRRLISPS
ncbi:DUF4349 domain-containing protein [Candidatus Uhrbacteria bacterium]|nr:DUF4349 domain-containing protein [Candidatus Uhrbacteria bacterium]